MCAIIVTEIWKSVDIHLPNCVTVRKIATDIIANRAGSCSVDDWKQYL